jgi:hypothetical protein
MHQIDLSPMRRDDRLEVSVSGDVFTINGAAFDFSALPEGASLPRDAVACDWLAGDAERIGGVLHLSLILPHGANAPGETRFPVPVMAGDGPVDLPPYEIETEDEA